LPGDVSSLITFSIPEIQLILSSMYYLLYSSPDDWKLRNPHLLIHLTFIRVTPTILTDQVRFSTIRTLRHFGLHLIERRTEIKSKISAIIKNQNLGFCTAFRDNAALM
jgi:hypothetical protein